MVKINSPRSRIRAALVNTGRVGFKEAERRLARAHLAIRVTRDAARTPAGQMAVLTAVATAARCFGAVTLDGAVDEPLLVALPLRAQTLGAAAKYLGARPRLSGPPSRFILFGQQESDDCSWAIRGYWNGWTAGVTAGHDNQVLGDGHCQLAGVAAGALTVCHAFLAEHDRPRLIAGIQGLSLWSPDAGAGWMSETGPAKYFPPDALWLIAFGNLGQANLWSLMSLPYAKPAGVTIYLQDDDTVREENWGTSVLTRPSRYGVLKTRIGEEWAEARGFRVRRVDRRLDVHQRRGKLEPGIALVGLDRMEPRRLLGKVGFEYVVDAGLGATAQDCRRFRVNVFDRDNDPAAHFADVRDQATGRIAELKRLPAYQDHLRRSKDGGCGTDELAGQSVAVPFVGAFTGALSVAQAVRIASGQAHHRAIAGDLDDLRTLQAAIGARAERLSVGYTEIKPKAA